jgi:hypothetical protein
MAVPSPFSPRRALDPCVACCWCSYGQNNRGNLTGSLFTMRIPVGWPPWHANKPSGRANKLSSDNKITFRGYLADLG